MRSACARLWPSATLVCHPGRWKDACLRRCDQRGGTIVMTGVVDLASSFLGAVLEPGTTGFDEARKVHNGLIDRRPAVIARCRGVGDIADAVRYARATGLEISVRGGGHNVGGRAVVEGGMMIDLSLMK